MDNYQYRDNRPAEPGLREIWSQVAVRLWDQAQHRRGLIFGVILVIALGAFEIFNFSTTEYALQDMLGDLRFAGLRWATILSIAFCGIDFAGLARLFTPERGAHGHSTETWYLIGAWFLGATMNAIMTWWAISLAMISSTHQVGNEIMSREELLAYVPVLVAALVWLTRILIIGTFSVAGDRLFSQAEEVLMQMRNEMRVSRPAPVRTNQVYAQRPAPRAVSQPTPPARVIGGGYEDGFEDEPEYVPIEQPRPRPAAPPPPQQPGPYRPATRPAPKPAYQPSQSMAPRNGQSDNHSGNGRS
jgi:hypothetical protein